jgi:hypothetical protein
MAARTSPELTAEGPASAIHGRVRGQDHESLLTAWADRWAFVFNRFRRGAAGRLADKNILLNRRVINAHR